MSLRPRAQTIAAVMFTHRLQDLFGKYIGPLAIPVSLTIAALLLGAEGTAQPPTSRSWSGPWDMVSFEVKSWGHPVTSWTLLADGSGSWTEAVREDGAQPDDYRLVWHEVAAGEDGYRQVERVLSRLPDPVPDYDDCTNRMTDQPYGTLRLTRGATTVEVAWNSGCMDDGYRVFIETLEAADTTVAARGRAGRVLRTERVGIPAEDP